MMDARTQGAADSMAKLAGGHVALAIHSVAEANAMQKAGKIRLLAVLSPSRLKALPDVPTAEEQGVMTTCRRSRERQPQPRRSPRAARTSSGPSTIATTAVSSTPLIGRCTKIKRSP